MAEPVISQSAINNDRQSIWNAAHLHDLLAVRAKPLITGEATSFAPPTIPLLRLGGGLPDPSTFPVAELTEAVEVVLRQEADGALQYGGPQGFVGLREVLARRIGEHEGIELGPGNFMLTNGISQSLANACFTFLDPGDVALVENPTFSGSIRTIRSHEAQVIAIPVDEDGLRIDVMAERLEEVVASGRRPKIIYTTPNFHNPTGAVMSLERRRTLVELAARYGVIIIEDDAYGELRYEGERVPSLHTLADGEGVIRMGTFSKIIGPGLRLGWSLASVDMINLLVRMRMDMGTSPFTSRVITTYAHAGRLDRHVAEVIPLYRRKRDAMLEALERYCGRWATCRQPAGGFFLWVEFDPAVDTALIAQAAQGEGISVVSGASFYCDSPAANYLRLAFSYISPDEIDEAMRRLARACQRVLG